MQQLVVTAILEDFVLPVNLFIGIFIFFLNSFLAICSLFSQMRDIYFLGKKKFEYFSQFYP